jgi:hypothetical protein
MEITVAETGERGTQQNFVRCGFGDFEVLDRQRLVRLIHHGGSHVVSSLLSLVTLPR